MFHHKSISLSTCLATLPRTPQTLNVFDEVDGLPADTSASKPAGEWETHVVLALNLSRMDVSTNMGNVMGQAM